MAVAPSRDLFAVPSSSISARSMAAWPPAAMPAIRGAIASCTFATAFSMPLPPYRDRSPSRSSSASWIPVDAPDGTLARPWAPLASVTSTSTVGFARESSTSRARTEAMLFAAMFLLARRRAPLLRQGNRLFDRLRRCRRAHKPVGVVAVIAEVPGIKPDQRDAVDQSVGNLAERPVRPVDGDDGLAAEHDGGVAGVAG